MQSANSSTARIKPLSDLKLLPSDTLATNDLVGAYKQSFANGVTQVGCMAHARRKCVDLHVTEKGCGYPVQQGVFSVEQRDQLIAGIQTLHASDGTPLAESLVAASELVDGQGRDAVILAFVDGTDGCEQDQCQVAAEIARNQPRLTINVVDVSSGGLSNCLAEQTGGKVFTSQDSDEVAQMLKDASYQLLDESYCQ